MRCPQGSGPPFRGLVGCTHPTQGLASLPAQGPLLGLLLPSADSLPVFSPRRHLSAGRRFLTRLGCHALLQGIFTNCNHTVFSPACKCFSYFTDSMCVFFFNLSPFPFLSLWVLSSFSDFYSNPTFSPKPSWIIQARVFFLPRILVTVGFIWISPLTAWCPGYLCGYLVPSEEAYTGKITYSFL